MYILKNKQVITTELLNDFVFKGWSEAEIAWHFHISRMQLYKIRRKLNCIDSGRSDKGKFRVDPINRRLRLNEYMREYRHKKGIKRAARRIGNKVYSESRLIAAKALGRPLKRFEVVHHIDKNPLNNANNNLVICTQKYHLNTFHS
jgi:hypothetical protein